MSWSLLPATCGILSANKSREEEKADYVQRYFILSSFLAEVISLSSSNDPGLCGLILRVNPQYIDGALPYLYVGRRFDFDCKHQDVVP